MANNDRNNQIPSNNASGSGDMSVREAGHKGGQRVSELVEKGKQKE